MFSIELSARMEMFICGDWALEMWPVHLWGWLLDFISYELIIFHLNSPIWLVISLLDSASTILHIELHPDEGININKSPQNCVFSPASSSEFWEEPHYLAPDLLRKTIYSATPAFGQATIRMSGFPCCGLWVNRNGALKKCLWPSFYIYK